jgi:hypothetical protein
VTCDLPRYAPLSAVNDLPDPDRWRRYGTLEFPLEHARCAFCGEDFAEWIYPLTRFRAWRRDQRRVVEWGACDAVHVKIESGVRRRSWALLLAQRDVDTGEVMDQAMLEAFSRSAPGQLSTTRNSPARALRSQPSPASPAVVGQAAGTRHEGGSSAMPSTLQGVGRGRPVSFLYPRGASVGQSVVWRWATLRRRSGTRWV